MIIHGRHCILDKLTAFHREHPTDAAEMLRDLQAVVGQVPPREVAVEAKPLVEELQRIHDGRRRGPQLLGDVLPIVLARLGGGRDTMKGISEVDPYRDRFRSRERLLVPKR